MQPVGNAWLRDRFQLSKLPLAHESFIGSRLSTESREGRTIETFTRQYQPRSVDDPLAHVEFGLKYDGVHLALLRGVFGKVPPAQVAAFVDASPSGRYARQIGFLFEFLTGTTLPITAKIAGPYVPILDPEAYVTAAVQKVTRWHVDNNLIGGPAFSPVVRRTPEIVLGMQRDWSTEVSSILSGAPPALLFRALSYLYSKETRSSFLIEREEAGHDREERFIAVLRDAGKVPADQAVVASRLVALQNAIVDPRYAETGFRLTQNYVGQTLPGKRELVHYIAPPPDLVDSLMRGLSAVSAQLESAPATVQAAVVAFQFVFVHPFDDGNGRVHRFLLQDTLARRGVVQRGALLPLSATILDDMPAYDRALEAFSSAVMANATYSLAYNGALTVTNPGDVDALWRYPDLSDQVDYLHQVMDRTVRDLPMELDYLRRYDRAREAIRDIVDMPDKRLSALLHWLDAGGGRLSNNKRKQHSELSDDEIQRVEAAYADAFEPDAAPLPQSAERQSRPKTRG